MDGRPKWGSKYGTKGSKNAGSSKKASTPESPGGRRRNSSPSIDSNRLGCGDTLVRSTVAPIAFTKGDWSHRVNIRTRSRASCLYRCPGQGIVSAFLFPGEVIRDQHLSMCWALRELARVRMIRFVHANGNERQVVTRPSPF